MSRPESGSVKPIFTGGAGTKITIRSPGVTRPDKPSDETLRRLIDAMPMQVAVVDSHWDIVAANPAWIEGTKQFNYGALLWIGQNYRRFWDWGLMAGFAEARSVLEGIDQLDHGGGQSFVHAYRSSLHQNAFIRLSLSPFEADGERYVTVSLLDMTELVSLRKAGVDLGARLMRTQASLLRVEEEERRRVARALHDSAAQYLVALNLGLAHLRTINTEPSVSARIADLSGLLEQFHSELRGITYVLHPPVLEEVGLRAAVRSLCAGFAERSGIRISVRIYGPERAGYSEIDATIYRVLQEALNNARNHARASHLRVRLSDRAGTCHLIVKDDGIGLKACPKSGLPEALGVGIPGMVARVAELAGRLVIRGKPGRGSMVAAAIPRLGAGQSFVTGDALARLQGWQRHDADKAGETGERRDCQQYQLNPAGAERLGNTADE
jgi:signal transduction histidine kinase